MPRLAFVAVVLCSLLALPVFGMDLSAGKTKGMVGETMQGYIAAVTPSAEASALVADINARRRAEYQRISAQNGQPLNVVEKLAAEKLYTRAQGGDYLQDASGQWKRK